MVQKVQEEHLQKRERVHKAHKIHKSHKVHSVQNVHMKKSPGSRIGLSGRNHETSQTLRCMNCLVNGQRGHCSEKGVWTMTSYGRRG